MSTASPAQASSERNTKGSTAVGLDLHLAGLVESREQVVQDLAGILGSGVAQGQNHAVSTHFRDGGQPATKIAVATALTAQYTVNTARSDGS